MINEASFFPWEFTSINTGLLEPIILMGYLDAPLYIDFFEPVVVFILQISISSILFFFTKYAIGNTDQNKNNPYNFSDEFVLFCKKICFYSASLSYITSLCYIFKHASEFAKSFNLMGILFCTLMPLILSSLAYFYKKPDKINISELDGRRVIIYLSLSFILWYLYSVTIDEYKIETMIFWFYYNILVDFSGTTMVKYWFGLKEDKINIFPIWINSMFLISIIMRS
ncbi:hypothetical protein COBT_001740, partial [Conglomerata obtusa]